MNFRLNFSLQESMKFNPDQEMITDWFTDRDIKVPHVILNDKLMSDAILGGMPIKTEHSYSLNSDGESMPHSPEQIDGEHKETTFKFTFPYKYR